MAVVEQTGKMALKPIAYAKQSTRLFEVRLIEAASITAISACLDVLGASRKFATQLLSANFSIHRSVRSKYEIAQVLQALADLWEIAQAEGPASEAVGRSGRGADLGAARHSGACGLRV